MNGYDDLPRRRICFLIDSLTGGGAERVICEIASNMDPRRFEVQLILTLDRTMDYHPANHVQVIVFPDMWVGAVRYERLWRKLDWLLALVLIPVTAGTNKGLSSSVRRLKRDICVFRNVVKILARHVRDWRPDCIVSFLPNSNMISLLAKECYGLTSSVVCSDRNHLSSELPRLTWPGLRKIIINKLYSRADAHIAVTSEVGDDLHRHFGVPEKLIHTIYNGVDIPRIMGRADQGVNENDAGAVPRLLAIGRLSMQKGFDVLLRALGRIRHLPWHMSILGVGEEEDALRRLANHMRITDRVEFAGWQENPFTWMRHSTLFISSSRWEGMPNVLLEAMVLGLPVVATDCPGGTSLLLDGGRVGLLVENDSEEALASGIAKLLEAPSERERLGKLAHEHSLNYGRDTMIDAYHTLIEDTIASTVAAR